MTTTLRVIVDDILAPSPSSIGRYTHELVRALIHTAPVGCSVAGIVSARPDPDYARLATLLPGMTGLFKSALARRELQLSWQLGVTRLPGGGMIHSTSLLAPLSKHDRVNRIGEQTVVTIHDTLAWTHPKGMTPHEVSWTKAMAKRAHRFADAVVVPTHSVAERLEEFLHFGERIRVIGGAVSSDLVVPPDADARAAALALPERFVLAVASPEQRKGLAPLIASLTSGADAGLPLVIAGPSTPSDDVEISRLAAASGVAEGRVRSLGHLSDADLAVAYDRATVFAFPSLAEGFGLPLLEAFHFGTPVVHSTSPALLEVGAGAGIAVPLEGPDEYSDRLADAIALVAHDSALAGRMRYAGLDRAAAFSWRDAAQRVWSLHADL